MSEIFISERFLEDYFYCYVIKRAPETFKTFKTVTTNGPPNQIKKKIVIKKFKKMQISFSIKRFRSTEIQTIKILVK